MFDYRRRSAAGGALSVGAGFIANNSEVVTIHYTHPFNSIFMVIHSNRPDFLGFAPPLRRPTGDSAKVPVCKKQNKPVEGTAENSFAPLPGREIPRWRGVTCSMHWPGSSAGSPPDLHRKETGGLTTGSVRILRTRETPVKEHDGSPPFHPRRDPPGPEAPGFFTFLRSIKKSRRVTGR
jgi:hypothetical protein